MAETKNRRMEVTGLVWSNAGYRIQVTDLDTGETFRWLPTDLIKSLEGTRFDGDWTTYRQGGRPIAKRVVG